MKTIKNCESGISHCPNSNTSLQSGIMPTRSFLDEGIKVGLGTDVAGGYSTSIFDSIKQCIGHSKLYKSLVDPSSKPITLAEAFYMANVGGARLLNIDREVGRFKEGM